MPSWLLPLLMTLPRSCLEPKGRESLPLGEASMSMLLLTTSFVGCSSGHGVSGRVRGRAESFHFERSALGERRIGTLAGSGYAEPNGIERRRLSAPVVGKPCVFAFTPTLPSTSPLPL